MKPHWEEGGTKNSKGHRIKMAAIYGKKFFLDSSSSEPSNEPRCEKTGLRGFRPGPTQTRLYNHTRWLRLEISYIGSRGIVLSL